MRCRFFAFAWRLAALLSGALLSVFASLRPWPSPAHPSRPAPPDRSARPPWPGQCRAPGRRGPLTGISRRRFAGGHGRRGLGDRCRGVGRGERVGRSRRDGFRRGLGLHRLGDRRRGLGDLRRHVGLGRQGGHLFGLVHRQADGRHPVAQRWRGLGGRLRLGARAPRAPAGPARKPAQTPSPAGRSARRGC